MENLRPPPNPFPTTISNSKTEHIHHFQLNNAYIKQKKNTS